LRRRQNTAARAPMRMAPPMPTTTPIMMRFSLGDTPELLEPAPELSSPGGPVDEEVIVELDVKTEVFELPPTTITVVTTD